MISTATSNYITIQFKTWYIKGELPAEEIEWIRGLGCGYSFAGNDPEYFDTNITSTTPAQEEMLQLRYAGRMHWQETEPLYVHYGAT